MEVVGESADQDRAGHYAPPSSPPQRHPGALRLGREAMVFLPGEPFVEIVLAIRAASPFDFTAVAGYTESCIGYIPTDRAFKNGGYEHGIRLSVKTSNETPR